MAIRISSLNMNIVMNDEQEHYSSRFSSLEVRARRGDLCQSEDPEKWYVTIQPSFAGSGEFALSKDGMDKLIEDLSTIRNLTSEVERVIQAVTK